MDLRNSEQWRAYFEEEGLDQAFAYKIGYCAGICALLYEFRELVKTQIAHQHVNIEDLKEAEGVLDNMSEMIEGIQEDIQESFK